MIRKLLVPALLAASLGTAPADAQTGLLCRLTSLTEPASGGVQIGELDGGPMLAADIDNPGEETARIAIRCTIQVGAAGQTHAGPDAATAVSASTPGVAVLTPTPISYVVAGDEPVWLCTQVIVNDTTVRYFNEPAPGDPGREWSTSDASVCTPVRTACVRYTDPGLLDTGEVCLRDRPTNS